MVKDNILYTPEPRNILRGISRQYIFDLAKELGISCVEKNLELYDVVTADEAFMTGTPFCLLPVTKINGMQIKDGQRGEITNSLLSKWSESVGLNIENQIKEFNQEMANHGTDGSTPYRFKNDS